MRESQWTGDKGQTRSEAAQCKERCVQYQGKQQGRTMNECKAQERPDKAQRQRQEDVSQALLCGSTLKGRDRIECQTVGWFAVKVWMPFSFYSTYTHHEVHQRIRKHINDSVLRLLPSTLARISDVSVNAEM